MSRLLNIPCSKCLHYISGGKCSAFREIPKEIILGKNKHLKPLLEQENDIIFEAVEIE